jgi:hypothetical protein
MIFLVLVWRGQGRDHREWGSTADENTGFRSSTGEYIILCAHCCEITNLFCASPALSESFLFVSMVGFGCGFRGG